MAARGTAEGQRISDEAVSDATGREWEAWFAVLDEAGAAAWAHRDTAAWLGEHHDLSPWWCQTVTVAYERARGLRTVGETATAGFEIGAQRTVACEAEQAWRFLTSSRGIALWLGDVPGLDLEPGADYCTDDGATGTVRTLSEERMRVRLTWQPSGWPDPSTLQLIVMPSGKKASIRFHQEKLADAEVREDMRAHWKDVLAELDAVLAG